MDEILDCPCDCLICLIDCDFCELISECFRSWFTKAQNKPPTGTDHLPTSPVSISVDKRGVTIITEQLKPCLT